MFHDLSGLIAHNPPGRYAAVAVADVDGDGRPEFVVTSPGGPNRVLRWAGGQLVDAPPLAADPSARSVAVAAGDLDGDGAEELYLASADGPDRLLKRHPDGTWADLLTRTARPGNHRVTVLDRRGGGRYAFAVSGPGPLRLIELAPDGRPLDLAPSLELASAGGWGLLAGPLLGKGPDLFVAADGPNALFLRRTDGTYADVAGRLGLADPDESGRCVAPVDVGGLIGLCVLNADGPHRLLVPAPGGWRDRATPAFALGSAVRAVVAADLDNDGHDELFVVNHGEPNRLFRVVASGGREPPVSLGSGGTGLPACVPELVMLDPGAAAEPDGPGAGAAVCDIDGDGVLELLVTQAGGPLRLYKSATAAGNGWLRVAVTTRFGAPARGAVVKLVAGGRERVKVVDGGGGSGGQSEPVAHFGLGAEAHLDRVTVRWPDGLELVIPDPDRDCTYAVPYPGG